MSIITSIKKIAIWKQMLIAAMLGALLGLSQGQRVVWWNLPIAQCFLSSLQLMVIPMIFLSISLGLGQMKQPSRLGRVLLRAAAWYAFTLLMASAIGLIIGVIIQPGYGLNQATLSAENAVYPVGEVNHTTASQWPNNLIQILSNNQNLLAVAFLALIVGLGMQGAGEDGKKIAAHFSSLAHVIRQCAHLIMQWAPVGVFSLMAVNCAQVGFGLLFALGQLLLGVLLGCAVQILIIYPAILWWFGFNPIQFYHALSEALIFAASSTSGAVTLPMTIRACQEKLGLPAHLAHFLLPLGAAFNLNGLALYLSLSTVFAANTYGIVIQGWEMLQLILMSVMASLGAGAVPGSGLFVMSVVFASHDIPFAAIGMIASVDRFIDMITTPTNVVGDAMTACVIARQEGLMHTDAGSE